jgi:hypothetical protein
MERKVVCVVAMDIVVFFFKKKMDGLCKNKRDWFQPSYLTLLLCIYVFERVLMVGGGFLFSLVRGGGDIKRRVFL